MARTTRRVKDCLPQGFSTEDLEVARWFLDVVATVYHGALHSHATVITVPDSKGGRKPTSLSALFHQQWPHVLIDDILTALANVGFITPLTLAARKPQRIRMAAEFAKMLSFANDGKACQPQRRCKKYPCLGIVGFLKPVFGSTGPQHPSTTTETTDFVTTGISTIWPTVSPFPTSSNRARRRERPAPAFLFVRRNPEGGSMPPSAPSSKRSFSARPTARPASTSVNSSAKTCSVKPWRK